MENIKYFDKIKKEVIYEILSFFKEEKISLYKINYANDEFQIEVLDIFNLYLGDDIYDEYNYSLTHEQQIYLIKIIQTELQKDYNVVSKYKITKK